MPVAADADVITVQAFHFNDSSNKGI